MQSVMVELVPYLLLARRRVKKCAYHDFRCVRYPFDHIGPKVEFVSTF